MLSILAQIFPFFALVACGYFAVHLKLFSVKAIPSLSIYVLYFAAPCMIYRFTSITPIHSMFNPIIGISYLTCSFVMVALTIYLQRYAQKNWADSAFGALVVAFPNSGFMGLPLLISMLGQQTIGPVVVSLSIDMIITSSICVFISGFGKNSWNKILKDVFVNPFPWAVVAGCFAAEGWISMPTPIMTSVSLLSGSASGAGLFTLGTMLANTQSSSRHLTVQEKQQITLMTILKLTFHPVIMLCIGILIRLMGYTLNSMTLTELVLICALPSASNVPMLAERYKANSEQTVWVVFTTTIFAFISISIIASLLKTSLH
jgi:malonate transporter and related proteins